MSYDDCQFHVGFAIWEARCKSPLNAVCSLLCHTMNVNENSIGYLADDLLRLVALHISGPP